MSIFEIIMLVCFGAAWPSSIYKSWQSRTSKGKSLPFLCIILVGYIAGTLHKVYYNMDFVIVLYVMNGLLVFIDICFYYRNAALDRQAEVS